MAPTCWYCEKTIADGEPHWSIQVAREANYRDQVEVESAAVWLSLCDHCAAACNLTAGPDIGWEDGQLTLLLAHDVAESPSGAHTTSAQAGTAPATVSHTHCSNCQNAIEPGDAFCGICGGAIQ